MKKNITRVIIAALILLFITIVPGCGEESDQTSDRAPRKSQTSDDYEALRKARRSGNLGDVHRELMKKTEGARDVDDLARRLKEAEERSR